MALRETASYILRRTNSASVAQCVTIGVVPSSCGSNFGDRDSQKNARKYG